jgi:hypothetical protein
MSFLYDDVTMVMVMVMVMVIHVNVVSYDDYDAVDDVLSYALLLMMMMMMMMLLLLTMVPMVLVAWLCHCNMSSHDQSYSIFPSCQ